MAGLGTIINVAAIIIGGLVGLIFSKVIKARYQDTLIQANGVCVLFVGIGGAVQEMMTVLEEGLIIICVMTAAMGKGCIFSAIPVGIIQGIITMFAFFIQPYITDRALSNLSLTGSMLIFCVGVNLIWGRKLKVANMLPAVVIAVICAFLGI